MAKVNEVYSSLYINVENWKIGNTPHEITDAGVDEDQFNKAKDSQIIYIQLDGEDARYRVNRTNSGELAKAFGNDTDEWIGKKVLLRHGRVKVKGVMTTIGEIVPVTGKKGKG